MPRGEEAELSVQVGATRAKGRETERRRSEYRSNEAADAETESKPIAKAASGHIL